MKSDNLISFLSMFLLAAMLVPVEGRAEEEADTLGMRRMDEVVVTGTRNATDMRHLSQTVSVVGTECIPQFGMAAHLPHTIELKASAAKGFRTTATCT